MLTLPTEGVKKKEKEKVSFIYTSSFPLHSFSDFLTTCSFTAGGI